MHNKFLIIDNNFIWSGSGNYNYYSFYRNYENFVKINKSLIAKVYSEEFEELKSGAKESGIYFGKYIEIYFSPEDNFKQRVIELINKATKSIEFMIYSFSDQDIADALIEAKNRGVDVKGLFDASWSKNQYSKDEYLQNRDINISYSNSKRLLHDKVMIIDANITITGSYNFTISANSENRENSIILKSNKIAKKYMLEFERIYRLR